MGEHIDSRNCWMLVSTPFCVWETFFRVIDGFILTWNYQRINSVTTAICYLRGLLHLGLEFGTEER